MSGLALPRPGARPAARRWPARPAAARVAPRPAASPVTLARPEAPRRPPAAGRRGAGGPLAVSLLGHAALLVAGLAATLLLPVTPPSPPAVNLPGFSVELAIAPAAASAPISAPAPAPVALGGAVPLPPPPAEPVVPPAAELVTQLAAELAAMLPAPSQPAAPGSAAPAAQPPASPPADAAPLLIANPRFRLPPRPPAYPRRAVELRAQGEALIGALLDPAGTPHDLRVLRSSGHPMLDRAALDAVGGWAFEPGQRGGQPVPSRVEIPVRFTLR